jgi:predicted AAA+ superfamily ATPase
VGKTTIAQNIAKHLPPAIYLDLERPSDLAKLAETELYLQSQAGKLIIIDEIQRFPNLFQPLRSIIDSQRQQGHHAKQFLLLGSASLDLLQQSSESLAGRIIYQELTGLLINEIRSLASYEVAQLWLRGGFPESFLASDDSYSLEWRWAFIKTYLERDIPQLGPRVPAETLRRLWTMLAHSQGTILNSSRLAMGLGVSVPTINRYLDLLVDLLLVRKLQPWSGNIGKRLVKSPKIYIRDSGLTHALLQIKSQEDLLSHPIVGTSWEGFIIENILALLPAGAMASFYRTAAHAEIDLVIEMNTQRRIAIEIKRNLRPTISKGFMQGCDDIQATHRYVVYPGKEIFPIAKNVTVIPAEEISMRVITDLTE